MIKMIAECVKIKHQSDDVKRVFHIHRGKGKEGRGPIQVQAELVEEYFGNLMVLCSHLDNVFLHLIVDWKAVAAPLPLPW